MITNKKRKFSITDKFVLYFLIIFTFTGSIITYLIYAYAGDAIISRTFSQLTSFKVVKKRQIETFFQDRFNELEYLINYENRENINFNSFKNQLVQFINHNNYFNGIIISNLENNIMFQKSFNSIYDIDINEKLLSLKLTQNIQIHDYIVNTKSNFPELFFSILMNINKQSYKVFLRISLDKIDKIMLETNPNDGVGLTGESYLIGNDSLLRSNSRFLKNSILNIKCKTEAASNVIKYDSTEIISYDYRGIKVLSSASKLKINGLNWYVLSEIDYDEAFIPIENMRVRILIISIILTLIIFIITYFLANRVTKPLIYLTNATKSLEEGTFLKESIKPFANDEIGDLTDAFNSLNENLRLKDEELKKEQIRRYTAEMDAQEQEKERLSRELHDGIGQMFVALKLKLENIDFNNSSSSDQLDEIKTGIDDTINEIRRISNNLMPSVLSSFGISTAVKNLINQLNQISKINFTYESNVEDIPEKKTSIYLYRIIQESLNNIIKHSNAENADIKLFQNKNYYSLFISDDGKGFDFGESSRNFGNGLYNIKERIKALGGKMNIESSLENGTILIINIPQ